MRLLAVISLLLFVAVALGGTFWWMTRDSSGSRSAEGPSVPGAVTEGSESGPEVALVGGAEAPLESRTAPRATGGTTTGGANVAARAPEAAARLSGRVVDDLGVPLAEAEVRVTRGYNGFIFFSSDRAQRKHESFDTETDADGRFSLEVIEGADLTLAVGKSGHAPLREKVQSVRGMDKDLGDLVAARGVYLAGRVVDRRGKGVAGAKVTRGRRATGSFVVMGPGAQNFDNDVLAETDTRGAFTIDQQAVGLWKLRVRSERHPEQNAEGETQQAGERIVDLMIVLEDGYDIKGSVTGVPADETGKLRVGARPASDDGAFRFDDTRESEVASDGSFELHGLSADTKYHLRARLADSGPFEGGTRSDSVLAQSGDLGVELPYSRGSALTFQVLDSRTGLPIEEFEAEAGFHWRRPLMGEDGRVKRIHPEGRVRFEGLNPGEGQTAASLKVAAVGYEDYEQNEISVRPGEDADLGVLRLIRIPLVRVVVTDAAGEPVARARVQLSKAQEEAGFGRGGFSMRRAVTVDMDDEGGESVVFDDGAQRTGRTDEQGVCTLSSFPGESCIIRITGKDFAPNQSPRIALPIDDDFEHAVTLSIGGTVDVLVLDSGGEPLPGAAVSRRSDGGGAPGTIIMGGRSENKQRTDSKGRVRFERLAPGIQAFTIIADRAAGSEFSFVRIEGQEDSQEWTEALVVEGETTEIVLSAPASGSLRGIVTEGGIPLADATVKLHEAAAGSEDRMSGLMGGQPSARTGRDGRYELADIPAGDYRLEITHKSRMMAGEIAADVVEGDNKLDIDLPVSFIEGRVTDEAGEPVKGLPVEARRAGGGRRPVRMILSVTSTDTGDEDTQISTSFGDGPTTKTDEQGRYSLRGVQPDVDLKVEVSGGDYEPASSNVVRVLPNEVKSNVDLTMRESGTIEVTALRGGEAMGSHLLVRASFTDDDSVQPKVAVIQGKDPARLTGLQRGAWTVSVSAIGSLDQEDGSQPEDQTVEVAPGETARLNFEMP